jgi:myo-inositol-1(or 4)-monophosphatase
MLDMMDEAILTAWNSARTGGAVLLAGFEAGHAARAAAAPPDATDYRLEAEKAIRRLIEDAFPEHRIVTAQEEGGGFELDANTPVWYVNALDGAFNYTRSSPFFSVSIGFAGFSGWGGVKPLLGVVLAPALMEMFWATLGGGAHYCQQIPGIGLSEGPISVSDTGRAENSVVKTEISGRGRGGPEEAGRQSRVQGEVMSFSREASATLNLAHVAAGRADCFYSPRLSPVSAVPASLLVSEAGGLASDFSGRPLSFAGPTELLATNRLLHGKFLELIGGAPDSSGRRLACQLC